jgi:hypothetical protein
VKAPALIAALIIVAGMPDVTFAQTKKGARSPQDVLRRVLELAKLDDLTDARALERKLGVTFVGGRLQKYDQAVFEPGGSARYEIRQPSGKPWKQVELWLDFATDKICIRESDFRAVFGPGAKRHLIPDAHRGFAYSYSIALKNDMDISGNFLDGMCMWDLLIRQNADRPE